MKRTLAAASFALLVAIPARASDQDFYLSVPVQGAILKLDAQTQALTPFANGLGIPFYGFFDAAGALYIPDRELGAIVKILPSGQVIPLTAGGLLSSVVTVTPAPGGGMVASDLPLNNVVHVSLTGQQTLIADFASSGGLLDGPGGLAYAPDGTLYVANNVGNTIVKIDPSGVVSPFSASSLINAPGGVVADGAGNLFVAMYGNSRIVRFRLDTGEATTFAFDPAFIAGCNDLKLSRNGGLLVTTRLSNLVRVHADGSMTEIYKNGTLGEIDGIAVPADHDPCGGTFTPYGTGLAGTGGFVPELRGIFSPCPGTEVGLELKDFLGGTVGYLALGLSATSLPFYGGQLLVNPNPPFFFLPVPIPGSGAGNGDVVYAFGLANDPGFVGLHLYMQVIGVDAGAVRGVSISNGLHEVIGD